MLRIVTGTGRDAGVYSRVLRQAAYDAVRAVLAAPPASVTASIALRGVTTWLIRVYGPGAAQDLAEELAVDLAEAFDALAAPAGRARMARREVGSPHPREPPPPGTRAGWEAGRGRPLAP